jgi:hypothetical protein
MDDEDLADFVRQRAKDCCEYCQLAPASRSSARHQSANRVSSASFENLRPVHCRHRVPRAVMFAPIAIHQPRFSAIRTGDARRPQPRA